MPPKSKGSKWEGDFDADEHKGRFGKPVSGKGKDGKGKDDSRRGAAVDAGRHDRDGLRPGSKERGAGDERGAKPGAAARNSASSERPGGGDGAGDDKDAKGKPVKGKGVRIEPHESGQGSRAHFHPEVSADLNGEADYKHHVTEHAKHYAGYLTHKDKDPERGEAHRQAANLHARVGNALHAGGDTKPAPPPPIMFGPPGQGGAGGAAGPGSSPGKDAVGRPLPGAPDGKRNPPGQDSTIGAQRRAGGAAGGAAGQKGGGAKEKPGQQEPPLQLVGKMAEGEARDSGGRWTHTAPLSATSRGYEGYNGPVFEHSSGAKIVRTAKPPSRAGTREKSQWHLHHKGAVHELPTSKRGTVQDMFRHAEHAMGKALYFGELSKGGERAGHKYTRRERQGDHWVYFYGDKEVHREAEPVHGLIGPTQLGDRFERQQRMDEEAFRHHRLMAGYHDAKEKKHSGIAEDFRSSRDKDLHAAAAEHAEKAGLHSKALERHLARAKELHLERFGSWNSTLPSEKEALAYGAAHDSTKKSIATLPLGARRIPLLLVPA